MQASKESIAMLETTLAHMRTLDEDHFIYRRIVGLWGYDEGGNKCGTICCVGGWHPKWYPETFQWEWYNDNGLSYKPVMSFWQMDQMLRHFYSVGADIIMVLFYGSGYDAIDLHTDTYETLPQVIARWEKVIAHLKAINDVI